MALIATFVVTACVHKPPPPPPLDPALAASRIETVLAEVNDRGWANSTIFSKPNLDQFARRRIYTNDLTKLKETFARHPDLMRAMLRLANETVAVEVDFRAADVAVRVHTYDPKAKKSHSAAEKSFERTTRMVRSHIFDAGVATPGYEWKDLAWNQFTGEYEYDSERQQRHGHSIYQWNVSNLEVFDQRDQ